jgi:4,5-DOPA dioxygenase extradiol
MNAIEHNAFTETLRGLSARLPRPQAVCVVSAHWVTCGAQVLASAHPRTIHDFQGFPRPLFAVQYPAPGAPSEAKKLAGNPEIVANHRWGLDHGSWSVLHHMYPKADVPAFPLSLDERRSFKEHLDLGREVQSLRERGVLILGSGNIVHNLRRIAWDHPASEYDWAVEFDARVKEAVERTMGTRWSSRKSGATPCWQTPILPSNTTSRCCTAWAAPTKATPSPIRIRGSTSAASRCA